LVAKEKQTPRNNKEEQCRQKWIANRKKEERRHGEERGTKRHVLEID